MSKLSKFKSFIPMEAAAKLLSDLIGEEVGVNDLMSLYEGGWLRLFRPCHGEIIKLKPMFDAELHEQHARDGRYFMESDHFAGISAGFYLPCDSVQISSRMSYAMRDADGGFYAVKDSQTDEYLSPYEDDDLDNMKVMVVTADLYSLARHNWCTWTKISIDCPRCSMPTSRLQPTTSGTKNSRQRLVASGRVQSACRVP